MKYFLILTTVFTTGFSLLAQTGNLVGKVIDEKGEPIPGASVIYRGDITIGNLTDDNGNYLLELPVGQCKVIYRYTSLITDTLKIEIAENQTATHNVTLKAFVLEIEGVDVKVGKFDKALEDQTVSMEIIRPEIIENKNTRSIETALDQTPGLNILDGEPQIRGGSGFTLSLIHI